MLIGVNVTSAASFRRAERFFADGLIDFVELLVDNFLHLDPGAVADELAGRPVALHVMASRYLHRDGDELRDLAVRLRRWADALEPLTVSDHLALHQVGATYLPEVAEVDYGDRAILAHVERWRDLVGQELLIENYPSASEAGAAQVEFFRDLSERAAVGPLFDFSNAVVGEKNGGAPAGDWLRAGLTMSACHISGYRPSEADPAFLVDSHDCAVSRDSWALLEAAVGQGTVPASLVVERDGRLDDDAWAADLVRARALVEPAGPP